MPLAAKVDSNFLQKSSMDMRLSYRSDLLRFMSLAKKKEPQSALFSLVEATGLVVRFGFALHTDSSTTVASDSTRLTAPR